MFQDGAKRFLTMKTHSVLRVFVAAVLLVSGAACASAGAETEASYAAAVRGACRDADIAKKEVTAMHRRQIRRSDVQPLLAAVVASIDDRARSVGDQGGRLRDLAVSISILNSTIRHRGDEGVASADVGVVRTQLGCP